MRIVCGPLFRQVTDQGQEVEHDRLKDREFTGLVDRAALPAGVCGDLIDGER